MMLLVVLLLTLFIFSLNRPKKPINSDNSDRAWLRDAHFDSLMKD